MRKRRRCSSTLWCLSLATISRVACVTSSGTVNVQFTSFFVPESVAQDFSSTSRPSTNERFAVPNSVTSDLLIGAFDPQSVRALSSKYELTATDQIAFPTAEWQDLSSNQTANGTSNSDSDNAKIQYARLNSNQINGSASLCLFISNSLAQETSGATTNDTNTTSIEEIQEVELILSIMQRMCQQQDVVAVLYPYRKLQIGMTNLFSIRKATSNAATPPLTEVSKLATQNGHYLVPSCHNHLLVGLPNGSCLANALTSASATMVTAVCQGNDCVCAGGKGDLYYGSSSQDTTTISDNPGTDHVNSKKVKSTTHRAILGVIIVNVLGVFLMIMGYVLWKRRQNAANGDQLPPGYVMTESETDTDYEAENTLSLVSQSGFESNSRRGGDCGHDDTSGGSGHGTNGTDECHYHLCVNSLEAVHKQRKKPFSKSQLAEWLRDTDVQAITINFNQLQQQQPIGKGGYGIVYKAVLLESRTFVALKRIRLDDSNSNVAKATSVRLRSLVREVELLMRLKHPNIVALLGITLVHAFSTSSSEHPNEEDDYVDKQEVGVVYEWMNKGDLRQFLADCTRRGRPNGFDQLKIRLASEIANALQFLHGLRVVHCDLKSCNILLNDSLEAKLSDFGLARELGVDNDPKQTASVHTRPVAGSHLWMAPEVLKGERFDTKADIFAFGVLLSELDTHELPYTHALRRPVDDGGGSGSGVGGGESLRVTQQHVLDHVASGTLQVLFTHSSINDHIVALAQTCVSLNPALRPTAWEIWTKLQQSLETTQQQVQ